MEKNYDVVGLGELLIDFTSSGKSEQGNHLFEACPGGAICNVLSMLSKLGRKTAFIGKVGNDQFGHMLNDAITEVGIDNTGLVKDNNVHTTLAFVHTLENGDRDFSFYRDPGADMMLTEDEVNYNLIRGSRAFHFGTLSMTSEPVCSATKKALEVAKESGCMITFDPNYRPPLWKSEDAAKEAMEFGLSNCDVLKISDNEVQFITGKEDYDEGIQCLIDKYNIPLIFLTMGKDGSRAYYNGNRVERPGFKVNAIETTGAGDTFCACAINQILNHGLENLNEKVLGQILTFANAAAALITQRKGALRAMPSIEELLQFINSQITNEIDLSETLERD